MNVRYRVTLSHEEREQLRFVEEGLEEALSEEPRPGAERKLSTGEEALLVATACTKPPAGQARWTLELLAGEIVRLTRHESISSETIRRRLAENARQVASALAKRLGGVSALNSGGCPAGKWARPLGVLGSPR